MNDFNINGLNDKQVLEKKVKYGSNRINVTKENKFMTLLLESLGDPIIKILLIALGIKVFFLFKDFDWYETIGILIAIFVASFISSISEYGSEKAFIKLQEKTASLKCRCIRNSEIVEISIDDVVVDDVISLESGEIIPADGYILSGQLTLDESSLSGEIKGVIKKANTTNNRIFRGTTIYNGNALMRVTEVGIDTMYGRLSKELQEKQPDSPLKLRLRNLAKIISRIGYISSLLVSLSYLFYVVVISNDFNLYLINETITNFHFMFSQILYALTLCVTIIVVSVPEGLPMMITLVLSSNMRRMIKDNVLVRKLVGIETAGSLNILFTDKTGTLTKGRFEVVEIIDGDMQSFKKENDIKKHSKFYDIFRLSVMCNNESYYNSKLDKVVGGNSTDLSLLSFFEDKTKPKAKIIRKIAFDSANKYAITQIDNGRVLNLIKGAPEKIIPNCKYYYYRDGLKKLIHNKENILNKVDEVAKSGIRVIALATSNNVRIDDFSDLTLVGIIFIRDEVRSEVTSGVELVNGANIQVVMVTGDNRETAISVAKEVGIIKSDDDLTITSEELSLMSDEKLMSIMPRLRVIARSLPHDKSRLVKVCQRMNLVVGMTGDGINDAPALKRADLGFAMGSGTEVSKEASDIVILDNNFISISKAILYGRTVFKNIRKFIIVQLTINLCAITLSIIGPFIGIPTPVTVIQMLWVNMIMDTLAGLAFAYEPPLLEYMKENPKKKDESIVNKYMVTEILFTGLYSAILCILFLKLPFVSSLFREERYLMTAFFGLFIFIDIFNSLSARTSRLNIFANIFKNKVFIFIMLFIFVVQVVILYLGGDIFRTFGLKAKEFLIIIILSLSVIPIDWIRKILLKKSNIIYGV